MIPEEKLDKLIEELGCVRALLERILRVMDEGFFVDYQMGKIWKNCKYFAKMPRM